MMRSLCSILVAFALTACAGVNPSHLVKVQDRDVLLLREDMVWSTKEEEMPIRVSIPRAAGDYRHRLKAGEYVAVYEDGENRYYMGPPDCLVNQLTRLHSGIPANWPVKVGHTITYGTCGVIMPKSGNGPARLFFVQSTALDRPASADWRSNVDATASTARGDALVSVAVQQTTVNSGSSVAAGVGAGIGAGLVGAMMDAEMTNWREYARLWNGMPASVFSRP